MTARYERAVEWMETAGRDLMTLRWGAEQFGDAELPNLYHRGDTVSAEQQNATHALISGTKYYMTTHIRDALKTTIATLPADFRLTHDIAPCHEGVLYFEHDLDLDELLPDEYALMTANTDLEKIAGLDAERCEGLRLRAIGWTLSTVTPAPGDDVYINPLPAEQDNVTPIGIDWGDVDMERDAGVVAYAYYVNDREQLGSMTVHVENFAKGTERVSRYPQRWLFAAWTFIQQELMITEAPHLDRAERRRLERNGLTAAAERLRVIYLRRPRSAVVAGTTERREWDCSWVVTGHWRNQWHPSTQSHKLRWIFPYVKGDTDKPLKVEAKRIYAIAR